jgi:HlyD family secretion protein
VLKSLALPLLLLTSLFLSGCTQNERSLQGYLEGEYTNLSTNFPGVLKQLLVSRGDEVKQDQLLFILDSEPEASQLEQAKQQQIQAEQILLDLENGQRDTVLAAIIAQRNQANANLILSTQNVLRYRKLYQQKATYQAALEQAEAAYQHDLNQLNQFNANLAEAKQGARENAIQAQRALVAAAKSAVNKASWQLAQKTVRAPVAGQIFDTYYQVGEFVNAQQPIAALLAPNDIKLIFYIPESQRSEIGVARPIYFNCDSCQAHQKAIINYISPEAEYTPPVIFSRESRKKLVYRVEAKLIPGEEQRFHPGQPVDVFLE